MFPTFSDHVCNKTNLQCQQPKPFRVSMTLYVNREHSCYMTGSELASPPTTGHVYILIPDSFMYWPAIVNINILGMIFVVGKI